MEDRTIVPNARQLRALTHPVRLRMLGMLRIDGPATATSLAERLGLNTGVTVYTQQLQRAIEERPLLPQAWREASTFSDWTHRLTAAQAKVLIDRIDELLSGIEDDDDPEAAAVSFNINVFPRPGALGEDQS